MEQLYSLYLSSSGVTTDTRNIAEGNLFFALKGERFNANQFAAQALQAGAIAAVIDEPPLPEWEAAHPGKFIQVPNVLTTLQQLAGYHRNQLTCPVIAITGSNGKTTTKELVAAVLSTTYRTYATKGNLNNHIGIPLTLLQIKPYVQMAIIEMGANHQGEIASYCEYVEPNYGLITNVGLAHTEGFGGFEGVVKGKTELYRWLHAHSRQVFINATAERLVTEAGNIGLGNAQLITYGNTPTARYSGSISGNGEFLSVVTQGLTINTNLVGQYNFENVMSAVAIACFFNVPPTAIKQAIENYVPTNNRSQKIMRGTTTIILDAYNANPSSMAEALKNLDQLKAPAKAVILGEMMELGEYAATEHQRIKQLTDGMQLTLRVFVGNGFAFLKNTPGLLYFGTTAELKEWFTQQQFPNTTLLIKGSRKNGLEGLLQ